MTFAYQKANIIGGNFQNPSGLRLSNGFVTFQLSHDSNISTLGGPGGAQVTAGVPMSFPLDTNGNFVGGVFLWTNDLLTPSGSYYLVNVYDSSGIVVWNFPQQFYIQPYAATISFGTLQPNTP